MYVRRADVLSHRTSRRAILRTRTTQGTLELDGIAALVWEALDGPAAIDDLVNDLCVVFDAPGPDVRAYLEDLLDRLVDAGVVRPVA